MLNGFTDDDLLWHKHSPYQIIYSNEMDEFQVVNTDFHDMICAFEFSEWADALAFLLQDVQVI
jgi:hypothetical protein